ncbi:MAG: hypothetical protein Q7J38_09410, partial [Gallionella sp.]|nr:hypothetical protein [Gallionella sp.]
TLRWQTLSGRISASFLTTLGMPDWIAESPGQYIEIAQRKAQDIPGLAGLRGRMRARFMSSVLGDTRAYVGAVEREYRQLWREWCGSLTTS